MRTVLAASVACVVSALAQRDARRGVRVHRMQDARPTGADSSSARLSLTGSAPLPPRLAEGPRIGPRMGGYADLTEQRSGHVRMERRAARPAGDRR
jgi:hypothetical protein